MCPFNLGFILGLHMSITSLDMMAALIHNYSFQINPYMIDYFQDYRNDMKNMKKIELVVFKNILVFCQSNQYIILIRNLMYFRLSLLRIKLKHFVQLCTGQY